MKKNCSKTRISRVNTGIFYIKLYVPFHKRKQILGFVIPVGDYLQHKRKIKMSQIVVFWADHKIKMPQN